MQLKLIRVHADTSTSTMTRDELNDLNKILNDYTRRNKGYTEVIHDNCPLTINDSSKAVKIIDELIFSGDFKIVVMHGFDVKVSNGICLRSIARKRHIPWYTAVYQEQIAKTGRYFTYDHLMAFNV